MLYRQKSRVQWLQKGDQNTSFFFKAMKSLHSRSRVVSVSREDGTRLDKPEEVKEEIVGFFQNLLSATPGRPGIDIDTLSRALPKRLPPDLCEALASEVSADEVRDVLFSLKDGKAPGPDGITALFFKHYWETVREDIMACVQSFFSRGD